MSNDSKLIAVIDTNILLVSISSRSKYHWLYQAILDGKFRIAVTSEILLEYEEKIAAHWSVEVASDVIRSLIELPNVVFTSIYFQLDLIITDKDDNKFIDCAFSSNADCIVTHDQHFNIIKTTPFPKIPVVDIHMFRSMLQN